MHPAHATGDSSGPVREQFLTIMCSDPELLGYAFDTIMTEQFGNQDANTAKGGPDSDANPLSDP